MRSVRLFAISAIWLGYSIEAPLTSSIGEDDDDIVLNIFGNHRIVINEVVATVTVTAFSGSATSGPYRLEAGPGATPAGPSKPNSAVGSGAGPAGVSILGNTDSAGSPPANKPSPPVSQPTVLVPACDPTLDRSSFDHLLLSPRQDFYYSQRDIGSGTGSVAVVRVPQLVYPAVQLQVSSAIQRVTCTTDSAQIQFANQAAYNAALSNWRKAGTFILVAYGEGCGSGHAAGEQDYLVVTSVTGDGSSIITAVIRVTDFEGAVGRETVVTIDIGTFNPTNGTGGFNVIPGADDNRGNFTVGGDLGSNGGAGGPSLSSGGPPMSSGDNPVNFPVAGSSGGNGGAGGPSLPSGMDNFDQQLDDLIGFVSIDDPKFDAQFFPTPPNRVIRHRGAADRDFESNIEKRGFRDFLKKIGDIIRDVGGTGFHFRQGTDIFCYRKLRQRLKRLSRHWPQLLHFLGTRKTSSKERP